MEQKYNLNVKTILEKQFHIDFKGYSPNQVDSFLDLIIADYDAYDEQIAELGGHLQRYELENKKLRAQLKELECNDQVESMKAPVVDQVDLLKRISNLENTVFKK